MAATPAAADVVRHCGGIRTVLTAVGFDFSKGAVRKNHTSDASGQAASDSRLKATMAENVCTATSAAVTVDGLGHELNADISSSGLPAAAESTTAGDPPPCYTAILIACHSSKIAIIRRIRCWNSLS